MPDENRATLPEVIVCTADHVAPDTCCCCGGSASLGGTQEPVPGSVPALRYCSLTCHDEWEDYLAAQREWRESDWCSACGFDNHEHADECPTVVRASDEKGTTDAGT